MQVYKYPGSESWPKLLSRPVSDFSDIADSVKLVLDRIKNEGDTAVKEFSLKFDKANLDDFLVSKKEMEEASGLLSNELKDAIQSAAQNILTFHESQTFETQIIETTPGVKCWQKALPIDRVGLYIPGGSAPLFSTALMLGIPAQIAGCKEITICTPPDKDGNIHPAILFAAGLTGVNKIFKIGGIQAIGAMAYGTETVPKVYKIFGPGNSWVTAAKQQISVSDCAIDMPAGPSELAIMADDSADPVFVAADLLSQAEHGPDSQVILVTTEESLIDKVITELKKQLNELPRLTIAEKALDNSMAIIVKDENEMLDMINYYAPEHLIVALKSSPSIAERITNAGSVFLGNYTPESAGDYASGTNHTLPTHGWARSYSGVNLDSFCKKITFQEISKEGIKNLGPIVEQMAEAEELHAHKNAATVRFRK
jgi:histidinol dehydrogenase